MKWIIRINKNNFNKNQYNWTLEMKIELLYYIALTSLFGVFLALLTYRMIKNNHQVYSLLGSVFVGFITTLSRIIDYCSDFSSQQRNWLLSIQVIFAILQTYLWYIHLERIISVRVNIFRYGVVMCLSIISIICGIMTAAFMDVDERLDDVVWFWTDLGYNIMSLVVFCFGFIMSKRSYDNNQDRRSLYFCVFYGMVVIGFVFIGLRELMDLFSPTITGIMPSSLNTIGVSIIFLGIMALIIYYIQNLDFIYTEFWETFILVVAFKNSGKIIKSTQFKTKNTLKIEPHYVSGILIAMKDLFGELIKSHNQVNEIKGKEISLLFESGKNCIAVAVTQKSSHYLHNSIKRFIHEFEEKYCIILQEMMQEPSEEQSQSNHLEKFEFMDYNQLINTIFPAFHTINGEQQ